MSDHAVSPAGRNFASEVRRSKLTNEEIARRLEVSERQVRRWKQGQVEPSWRYVQAWAELFGREPGWFYLDHGPSEPNGEAAA